MRLARLAWIAPACLAFLASPSLAEERYRLEFKEGPLKRIAIESPMGNASSYWYLTYTLKNVSKKTDVKPHINIWATTDTPWDFRDGLAPLAEMELERKFNHPLFNLLELRRHTIKPGETVNCVAIFQLHDGRDLRQLIRAMNFFTTRDHKAGLELLRDTKKRYHEGKWIKWVDELLTAAEGGLDAARAKTVELRKRWNKQKKSFVPSAKGEGEDFNLLNDAIHMLRTRDYEGALEKLERVEKMAGSRCHKDANRLRTLAARRRVEEMDAYIERYLYGYQPDRLKNEPDHVDLHVSGLWDIVFADGVNVYRENRILKITLKRPGDEFYPQFEGYRFLRRTEYVEGQERKFIRKTHEDRGTK